MNVLVRDLAIFIGVLIVLSLVSLARSVGRRRRSAPEPSSGGGPDAEPVAGLTTYATAHAWAPTPDLSGEDMARRYAEEMLRNLFGAPNGSETSVSGPVFENLFTGQADGRTFVIGNARMGVAGTAHAGSVCVLHLSEALPPLFVNLRRRRPYVRVLMKEMTFESEAFNRRFSVLAIDREYAMDVITARAMEILMERDDWVFALEFDRIVCVASSGMATVEDYTGRLDAVTRFADQIPHFVDQDKGVQMPTLPDGTTVDLTDPASRERFKEAFLAMAPEEREQMMATMRERGAKFLVGMLGSRVPPGLVERLEERLAAATEQDAATGGTGPAPTA